MKAYQILYFAAALGLSVTIFPSVTLAESHSCDNCPGSSGYMQEIKNGICKCVPQDQRFKNAQAKARANPQQDEMELLYPMLKEFREKFEGKQTKGIIDLKKDYYYDFTQFTLTQLVNGYGIFHYAGSATHPAAAVTVAVKQSTLSKAYDKGNMTYQIALIPGLPLGTAIVGKCLRFLKNQKWESETGFPIAAKTYTAIKCPAN